MTAKHYVPSQHQKITLNKKHIVKLNLNSRKTEIKINMF